MEVQTIYCDRCKAKIGSPSSDRYQLVYGKKWAHEGNKTEFDLCDNCIPDFANFINNQEAKPNG